MRMMDWRSIPWENAGAAMENKMMVPPIKLIHAMETTQNAHLELIYRECIRGNQIEVNG